MKRLILITFLLLTGCATQPLSSLNYVGDDWYVASFDEDSSVFVHTKQLEMNRWAIRYVNSGTEDICIRVNYLQEEYNTNVLGGWYRLSTFSTKYIGFVENLLGDANWIVNTMEVVPYNKKEGCIFPQS